MSNNSPQNSRDGNNNNSESDEDYKNTVSSTNVLNAVKECIKSINSKFLMLMACYDVLKKSLINISKDTTVKELVIVKKFVNDYKHVVDELISNTNRLIELIGEYLDELNNVLQRSQIKRVEIEKSLNRVSSQNVIIDDAAQLYFLNDFNKICYSYSTKPFMDSREMLFGSLNNLGAASLNSINETYVNNNVESLMDGENEKQENEIQKIINRGDKKEEYEGRNSRALEAYNQYIIIAFPILTKTNDIGASRSSSRQRRINIPERPRSNVNMWSVMKNSIGKDISRIPMPVNFSEPISALQRLVECFEYSHILDRAADCSDALEQLAYVAAFSVSGYSTNSNRTSKPFNPLLGETFEWDRTDDDYGWKVISEQVSHHPPVSALHCAGKDWTCWEEFSGVTKFRGRYLTAEPKGIVNLEFNKGDGHRYTWKKVSATIHNIVIGKMYVEQNGEVDVIDHTNGAKCHLNFLPNGGYFGRDSKNRVFGTVKDTSGRVRWLVDGVWDKYVEIGSVISVEGTSGKPVYKTDPKIMVWECTPLPENSEKQYNFTLFARQLNEMEEEVAPTDSRRRPDQRLMEEGNWDEANVVKVCLEQKQRERSGSRHSSSVDSANDRQPTATGSIQHQPVWFKQQVDPVTRETMYVYQNGYWEAKQEQDWSMCPNIFTV